MELPTPNQHSLNQELTSEDVEVRIRAMIASQVADLGVRWEEAEAYAAQLAGQLVSRELFVMDTYYQQGWLDACGSVEGIAGEYRGNLRELITDTARRVARALEQ